MIRSILDNDLYKFSMMYAILQKFPNTEVKYKFINRNKSKLVVSDLFLYKIRSAIDRMAILSLSQREKEFLLSIPYFPRWFVDFLAGYTFNPDEVKVTFNNGELNISIEGPWYRTVLWEVPILAIVSELYYEETGQYPDYDIMQNNLNNYANLLKDGSGVKIAEFGTRRRFSFDVQNEVVNFLTTNFENTGFVGTSNVYLAMKYGVKPIGTMAHEWIMAHGAVFGYKMANTLALNNWSDVYRGDLGIYLPDTYTTKAFLPSFDKKMAKLFDGVRQDSGNPIDFANMMYDHYTNLGINPKEKTIVFSDALNVEAIKNIHEAFKDKMKISYGVGTNLSNNVGCNPMNIVIKLSAVKVNGNYIDAIKLSDDPIKHTGHFDQVTLCKKMLNL